MSETAPIRVLIVDDHAVVRSGLATFLQVSPDLQLVGEAVNGVEAIRVWEHVRPDVVLMDLVMPVMDGVAATHAIRQRCRNARIIALTSFVEEERVQAALEAGAIGYLLKDVSMTELAEAIRTVHAGRPALAPEATKALMEVAAHPHASDYDLTPREREVLALMVAGATNPDIAKQLVVGRSTVKFHVSSILAKLQVASRTEAVAFAIQHHLSEPAAALAG